MTSYSDVLDFLIWQAIYGVPRLYKLFKISALLCIEFCAEGKHQLLNRNNNINFKA